MTKQEAKEQEAKAAILEAAGANNTIFMVEQTLRDMLDGITERPDVLTVPAYAEMVDHLYMAGRSAATVSKIMGKKNVGLYIDWLCDQIARIEDEHNLG